MALKMYYHGSVGPLYYDDTQDLPGVTGVKQSPLYFPDGAVDGYSLIFEALTGRAKWAVPSTVGTIDLTSGVTGVLPIANGGTASATKNFVDLSTTQAAIAGAKTFTTSLQVYAAYSGTVGQLSVYGNADHGVLSVDSSSATKESGVDFRKQGVRKFYNYVPASSTDLRWWNGSADAMILTNAGLLSTKSHITALGGTVTAGVSGTTRGILYATRGSSTNTPGVNQFESRSGTTYYKWITDGGSLRRHTSLPTADTDGLNVASRSFVLSAASLIPGTTGGCGTPTQKEAGTSLANYYTASFDKDTANVGYWMFNLPDNYDGGTLTAVVTWECSGGSAAQKVDFEISGVAYADNTAVTTAFGTMQSSIDTWQADNAFHLSPVTSAITLAGTPAKGNLCCIRLRRDAADGTDDTLAAAALVSCLRLEF